MILFLFEVLVDKSRQWFFLFFLDFEYFEESFLFKIGLGLELNKDVFHQQYY